MRCAALSLALVAAPALAGPPYLTDDPVPTDTGHWEIYAFTAAEGRRSSLDADAGFDLNYGPVKGVQLTATLPLSFSHEPNEGWRGGTGDVELGVKYRFFNDAEARPLRRHLPPRHPADREPRPGREDALPAPAVGRQGLRRRDQPIRRRRLHDQSRARATATSGRPPSR